MISLSFFDSMDGISSSVIVDFEEMATFVAIQWHISDHSGFFLDGASGSVKAIVYVRPDNDDEIAAESMWSLTVGAS